MHADPQGLEQGQGQQQVRQRAVQHADLPAVVFPAVVRGHARQLAFERAVQVDPETVEEGGRHGWPLKRARG